MNGPSRRWYSFIRLSRITVGCVMLAGACRGREPPAEEEAPPQQPAVELPSPFEPGALDRVDQRAVASRADLSLSGAFAHEPHRQVSCAVCHSSVPGHSTHPDVACRDCHPAPAPTTPAVVQPSQCLQCHHVQQTVRDCSGCHTPAALGTLSVVQHLRLSVWDQPRDRSLPFDHGNHGELACSRCHESDGQQTFAAQCADCHEPHHGATVRCMTCHPTSPLEAHDAGAHRGCSGTGCHSASLGPIPESRQMCLVCHVAQVDHEPGGECSRCHLLEDIASPPSGPGGEATGGTVPW